MRYFSQISNPGCQALLHLGEEMNSGFQSSYFRDSEESGGFGGALGKVMPDQREAG